MIFVNGVPEPIDKLYFRARYGQNFPDLLPSTKDAFLDSCIDDVYTMFVGVNTAWQGQEDTLYYKKTQLCFGLLTAWYIADIHPEYAVGVVSSGGIPVKRKSIGGINVQFGSADEEGTGKNTAYRDALAYLKSNHFGYKAYTMIKNSAMNIAVRGRRVAE